MGEPENHNLNDNVGLKAGRGPSAARSAGLSAGAAGPGQQLHWTAMECVRERESVSTGREGKTTASKHGERGTENIATKL